MKMVFSITLPFRINSAIIANTAKNKKKAEKKKRALERRMSEGDAGSFEAINKMNTSSSLDLSELQQGNFTLVCCFVKMIIYVIHQDGRMRVMKTPECHLPMRRSSWREVSSLIQSTTMLPINPSRKEWPRKEANTFKWPMSWYLI